ncbi:exodeoxyribonuclease VII large subunit [Nitrosomonas sp. Nm51]|uniref:exodeoxyribonuclease VII large subunit n=1 Tax=Nitrosomonas sp. Nm51 TaxID=133720 RepID=UPI0008CE46B3|nr:exodeoxyribonuclease VII large subunit [Nitrosomonas sp. Nm51]SER04343.1 exodeoxyribonuclease VII large subunit [Nitrosomonas sp. Nm51]
MNLSPTFETVQTSITVSELNRNVKTVLENNIPLIWVNGEISNLKRYPSGHWYFSLKDADAQVRCVMFRHKNQYLDWQPREGIQVEVLALVTLYEARGDYQLNVETIRRAGLGTLFEAFERLKKRLEKDGLFDASRKKRPPVFPRQIGIITSSATAALHDVVTTLKRRMPSLPIVIYPTPVQGRDAAKNIASAISAASTRHECDVLILCRGGGGIEDLWAFNEEIVAHAIAACTIPVISGIGHETDFTIADFVADKRAPTPTAAAEMASPAVTELKQQLNRLHQQLHHAVARQVENRMQKIDLLAHRHTHPGERIQNKLLHHQHLQERLNGCISRQIERKSWTIQSYQQRILFIHPKLVRLTEHLNRMSERLRQACARHGKTLETKLQHQQAQLTQLNPQTILNRGYSITYSSQGTVVSSANQIYTGEKIQVKFAQGHVNAAVTNTNKKNSETK